MHDERLFATGGIESWMRLRYLLRYSYDYVYLSVDFRHEFAHVELALARCGGESLREEEFADRLAQSFRVSRTMQTYTAYSCRRAIQFAKQT